MRKMARKRGACDGCQGRSGDRIGKDSFAQAVKYKRGDKGSDARAVRRALIALGPHFIPMPNARPPMAPMAIQIPAWIKIGDSKSFGSGTTRR